MLRMFGSVSNSSALLCFRGLVAVVALGAFELGCGAKLEVLLDDADSGAARDPRDDAATSASQWPNAPDGVQKDAEEPRSCGVPSAACTADQFCTDIYCSREFGATQADAVCSTRPLSCPSVADPTFGVCGCDERAYASPCDAHRAGVQAQVLDRACLPKRCTSNGACAVDEFCDFPQGACSRGGAQGVCTRRPTAVDCPLTAACPVPGTKGCDGSTYCRPCEAEALGIAVERKAACTFGQDQTCNDNPATSSLHGACDSSGRCGCIPPSVLNDDTGRCL